jgi:hypothetical protein
MDGGTSAAQAPSLIAQGNESTERIARGDDLGLGAT